jgi:hypothetical protein
MSSTITALTSGGGLAMAGDTSGQLELKTNSGTTAVTIDTSQNVGIGTASPTSKLDVTGAISLNNVTLPSAGTARIYSRNTDSSLYIQSGSGNTTYLLDGSQNTMANFGSSLVTFATSNTERMRITSGGNLLVNTTTQFTTGGFNPRVTLNAPADGFAIPSIGNGYIGYLIQASGSHNYYPAYFLNSGNNGIGNIQCSTTSTSFNTSSDYRLKDEITPMTGALAKVSALKPVTYKWKIDGSDGQGFIAHELAEVVPDAVSGEKDATEMVDIKDEDGKIIGQEEKPVYQGIDTSFLVATLTAAIQELNAKVDAQALEIQALKGVA